MARRTARDSAIQSGHRKRIAVGCWLLAVGKLCFAAPPRRKTTCAYDCAFTPSSLRRFVASSLLQALDRTRLKCYLVFSTVTDAQNAVIHVDSPHGVADPPNFGQDGWGSQAHRFLQEALGDAEFLINSDPQVSSVDIWVKGKATSVGSPYWPDEDAANPNGSGDRSATFEMLDNVRILGGFAGDETSEEDRDPGRNLTILSGDLNEDDQVIVTHDPLEIELTNYAENSYHIVTATDVGSGAELDGFTIRGGFATDTGSGGGILIGSDSTNSSPRILDCIIKECSVGFASNAGGAGGIHVEADPSDTIEVYTEIRGCEFIHNGSKQGGGGVKIVNSNAHVLDCVFTENHSGANNIGSGGIQIRFSNVNVHNCRFEGNRGDNGGAVDVDNESVSGFNDVSIVNSLFHDNDADNDGGAIYHEGGLTEIINCMLSDNEAAGSGGGLRVGNVSAASVDVDVWSSIIFRNNADSEDDISSVPSDVIAVGYSDTGGLPGNVEDVGGNISANPMFIDPSNDNYRLRVDITSPCEDAGNPDTTVIPPDDFDLDEDGNTGENTPDLDLQTRVAGQAVEMGAYEVIIDVKEESDLNNDGWVGMQDANYLLADWGTDATGASLSGPTDVIDVDDLQALFAQFGNGTDQAVPVPESNADCVAFYAGEPLLLQACIDAMAEQADADSPQ